MRSPAGPWCARSDAARPAYATIRAREDAEVVIAAIVRDALQVVLKTRVGELAHEGKAPRPSRTRRGGPGSNTRAGLDEPSVGCTSRAQRVRGPDQGHLGARTNAADQHRQVHRRGRRPAAVRHFAQAHKRPAKVAAGADACRPLAWLSTEAQRRAPAVEGGGLGRHWRAQVDGGPARHDPVPERVARPGGAPSCRAANRARAQAT